MVEQGSSEELKRALKVYDFPWCMGCLSGKSWTKRIPLCPNFEGCCNCRKSKTVDDEDREAEVKYNGHMDEVVVVEGQGQGQLHHRKTADNDEAVSQTKF